VPETPANSGLAFLTIDKMFHFVEWEARGAGKGNKTHCDLNRPIKAMRSASITVRARCAAGEHTDEAT
jgi:hypothetical protein